MPPGDAMVLKDQPSKACLSVFELSLDGPDDKGAQRGWAGNGDTHREGHGSPYMFQPAVMTSIKGPRSLIEPVARYLESYCF